MNSERALHAIPDDELLRRLGELVSQSRRVEADLVAHIGEVDERRLYAREASPSMFAYCTERLHLSEAEAYRRITVARAARKHEVVLAMLRDGRLHLTGIAMLAPLLTPENRDALLERATHQSKRQIQELVAELSPRPDAPSVMRRLPEKRQAPLPEAPRGPDQARLAPLQLVPDRVGTPAVVEPLSPARYKVQFTASAELRDKLERLCALMRSEIPDGDLAAAIDRAVTEKLERLEARRHAKTSAPRKGLAETNTSPASRHIPAAVRRAVRERDGDRCGYVDEQGRRCSARDRLEFHHRHPFGMGGGHSVQNIRLLCRSHNRYLAEHDYGRAAIRRQRRLEKEAPA
jgi:5-methylcytosine-specific restriction endonuclease McrA